MENTTRTPVKDVCCPVFDPTPWEDKTLIWENKTFVKGTVRTFFHIPLNFASVITGMFRKIKAADAEAAEYLALSYDPSAWQSELYIAVSKPVDGMDVCTMNGTYLTKVFEGPYKDAGKWHEAMLSYVSRQGKEAKKIYFYYTTCPKCAKKYGKNYAVGIAEV